MMAITISEFSYLLPMLILGCAIIILLFLFFLIRINTKQSAIFAVASLLLALISSSFIGYNIISHVETNITTAENTKIEQPAVASDLSIDPTTEQRIEQGTAQNQEANDTNVDVVLNQDIQPTNVNESLHDAAAPSWQASYITALFTADAYGALYTSLILMVSIVVSTLAYKWFSHETANHGLFYLIVLFAALGATILIYASHLISLFIGIELLSIPIVGLIGYQYMQKYSLEATIKYMVLSAIATTFLLLGIAFYYGATGELTFSGLSFQLSTLAQPSPLLLLGVCLMLVGIGFKLSLVPFQLWLPDVYQGAPACVSLLLTTVGKVAIFCSVARLFLLAPVVNNETIRIIMVVMAFCSIIWGSVLALKQHNLKRLLAYSSITHFGYLLIALIAVQYQVLALETIGVYLVGYILANVCILGVISLESRSVAKQDHDNDIDLCGLFWRRPIMALSMGMGLLSLAGIPLTIGFIGRFSLILLAVTAELWWLVGAVIVGSVLGLYFYLRLAVNLYIKPINVSKQTSSSFKLSQIGINELFIVISALLIMLNGVYPKWLFNLVTVAKYLMPQ